MFRQTKFAVPSEFFLVTFADCSSNLVACRHFICLMLLFQRHVARRNLPSQGLRHEKQEGWKGGRNRESAHLLIK